MSEFLLFYANMAQFNSDLTKNLLNIRKTIDLPKVSTTFWGRIYYFFFPSAKYIRQNTERYNKTIKRLQNQRYYAKHQSEIRRKRKEYYELMGK